MELKTSLKILAIGNSFSDDAMEYVWQIATDLKLAEIVLGNLYIGGCPLKTHLNHLINDRAAYEYRTNTTGEWSTQRDYRLSDAIKSQDWDFITMQQASPSSGVSDTYAESLPELISRVRALAPQAKLAWHMTWAYQQDSPHPAFSTYDCDQSRMYNAIVSCIKEHILPNPNFAKMIPSGTAIQQARALHFGDTLTRDGHHLSIPVGRYIAGVTMVHALTGKPITDLHYAPAGMSNEQRQAAIDAAMRAVQRWEAEVSDYV